MNLRKDHYRWSGAPRGCLDNGTSARPLTGPKASISCVRRVPPRGGRPPRSSLGLSVRGRHGPAGEGPVGTSISGPAVSVAAPRVPNPPPASGGNAGGSMSPASVPRCTGGLGAPGGPVASELNLDPVCLDTRPLPLNKTKEYNS